MRRKWLGHRNVVTQRIASLFANDVQQEFTSW
jgi:hypothetical protein